MKKQPWKSAADFAAFAAAETTRIDRLKSQLIAAEERQVAYVKLSRLCESQCSTAKVSELQNGVEITLVGADGLPKRGSDASIAGALANLLAAPGVKVAS